MRVLVETAKQVAAELVTHRGALQRQGGHRDNGRLGAVAGQAEAGQCKPPAWPLLLLLLLLLLQDG